MLTESSMMERWFFYQDAAGLWKWARLDLLGAVLGHSGCSFGTRDACVEHAALNGYEGGKKPKRGPVVPRNPVRRTRSSRPNQPSSSP